MSSVPPRPTLSQARAKLRELGYLESRVERFVFRRALQGCAVVAIPDINQALKGTNGRLLPLGLIRLLLRKRYITQMRLLLLGVEAGYRALGLYPLLVSELHRQVKGSAYRRAELSWVLEDNLDINQPAESIGARRYKTYRIYEKALVPCGSR